MKTTRLPKLVIVFSLILVALFAYQAFKDTAGASANNGVYLPVGFGDLRRVEAQQSLADRPIGFGDLRRFEGQQSLNNTVPDYRPVGFGDLRRFEAQQAGWAPATNPAP